MSWRESSASDFSDFSYDDYNITEEDYSTEEDEQENNFITIEKFQPFLSALSHLWEICVNINSFLQPKHLFNVMLACCSFHDWIVKYNLEKWASRGISICERKVLSHEIGILWLIENYGHTIEESQLVCILKKSSGYGLERVMFSVLDLMDTISFETVLFLNFKNQEVFDQMFKHPKIVDRINEFQFEFINHLQSNPPFQEKFKFFFNSILFDSVLENSLKWVEKNGRILVSIHDLNVKMRQIPMLKQIVKDNFDLIIQMEAEKLNQIVVELSKKEREFLKDALEDGSKDIQMECMRNFELCKIFGKSVLENANSKPKKPHNLISTCLRTNPDLVKDFDLRSFGYELIVNRQFAILSGLISTFSLKFIEQLAPSPRSFLVLVLRDAFPLGSNSNYLGLTSKQLPRKSQHEEELIFLIENMFNQFPGMKIRRFNDKVLKEAQKLNSLKIVQSIKNHKDFSKEEKESSDCSSSEDEYSLSKSNEMLKEIDNKRVSRNESSRRYLPRYRNRSYQYRSVYDFLGDNYY